MILCGERVKADKALEIGLVEEVVPTGQALERAMALAEQVGQQSPIAVAACKRLIHSARDIAIARGLEEERTEFVDLFSTADQREGVNAFLEKRKPEWKNQ
jgi:enoyl-CoA hydratase/carnithine racemase